MTPSERILVMEPERNIRAAMVHALEAGGYPVGTAADLDGALRALRLEPHALVILDLGPRDADGLEVLRALRREHPTTRVVVTTAHGRIDRAVQAMKLGAADLVEKPISGAEIVSLARSVLEWTPEVPPEPDYARQLRVARRALEEQRVDAALPLVRHLIGLDPGRPEAFNLLGAAIHLGGQRYRAQDYFRAALALDPTYRPAQENLERSVGGREGLPLALCLGGDGEGSEAKRP